MAQGAQFVVQSAWTAPFPFGRFWTKVRLLVVVLAAMAGLWALQGAVWSSSLYPWDWLLWRGVPSPHWPSEWAIQIAMGAWVLPLLPMLFGLLGMLGHPRRERAVLADPLSNLVSFRIVSRGQNVAMLRETVRNIEMVMHGLPVFRWAVEVLSWLGLAAFWGDLVIGQVAPWQVRAAGDISLVCFYTCYLAGLAENLRHSSAPRWRRCLLYLLQVVLVPAFTLLEAAAVAYGLITRGGGSGFHVIAKPVEEQPLARAVARLR